MSKIKLSLSAIAFVVGIGGAFATNKVMDKSADDCQQSTQCEIGGTVCCFDQATQSDRPGTKVSE